MRVLFLIVCFLLIAMFSPRQAEAQCSRGCPMISAPAQATAHVGIVIERAVVAAAVAPVRIVARVAVAVHERPRIRAAVRGWFFRCR